MPKMTAEPSLSPNVNASTRITPSALPSPTYIPQDPTKKTHARKQPAGHVPRPRNAFILFRCDFVRQGKVPTDVENDHRNISRIAGRVWREMSVKEREPWVKMAEEEKKMHGRVHPGYRYTPHMPQPQGKKKKKEEVRGLEMVDTAKGRDIRTLRRTSSCPDLPEPQLLPQVEDERTGLEQRLPVPYLPSSAAIQHHETNIRSNPTKLYEIEHEYLNLKTWDLGASPVQTPSPPATNVTPPKDTGAHTPPFLFLRRPSSCPPGAQRISSAQLTHPSATSALQITRDDLARRPSRVTMYQSSPTALVLPGHGLNDNILGSTYPALESPYVRDLGKNSRPPLLNGPYRIDPPRDAPGWDAPPPAPLPMPQAETYPWAWGWGGNEGGEHRNTFDYLDLPQHVYGEVTKSDLEGISRAGLEGISPVDVESMLHAQDPENVSPQYHPPVFTNPFASAHTAVNGDFSAGPYDAAGKPPISNFVSRDPDHLGYNSGASVGGVKVGAQGASIGQPGEMTSHDFLAHEEALIGQLFPRMSLDDRVYDLDNIHPVDAGTSHWELGV